MCRSRGPGQGSGPLLSEKFEVLKFIHCIKKSILGLGTLPWKSKLFLGPPPPLKFFLVPRTY